MTATTAEGHVRDRAGRGDRDERAVAEELEVDERRTRTRRSMTTKATRGGESGCDRPQRRRRRPAPILALVDRVGDRRRVLPLTVTEAGHIDPARAALSSLVSRTKRRTSAAATTQKGMLMKKTARQLTCSANAPPTKGPSAIPTALNASTMLIARPRRSWGRCEVTTAIATGKISAAPNPWTIRAAISQLASCAEPQIADRTPKTASPHKRSLRRPKMSARRPADQERAEREHVAADHPLQVGRGHAEVLCDRRHARG